MRVFSAIVAIVLLCAFISLLFPWQWWFAAAITFLCVVLLHMYPAKGFVAGMLGVGLFWLGGALLADVPNRHILSTRMAALFGLPNFILFILVTVLAGAIIGGLSGWAAGWMNRAFRPQEHE